MQLLLTFSESCQTVAGSAKMPSQPSNFSSSQVLLRLMPSVAPNSTKNFDELVPAWANANKSCDIWDLECGRYEAISSLAVGGSSL